MNQVIYQMISYLLSYPNREMKDSFPEIKMEMEKLNENKVKECMNRFMNEIEQVALDDWTRHYIDQFDFGRLTNLYVTYLKLGEQRERGLELLKLKKYYEAHGFLVTDKELPDYLPIILEFCAQVPIETSNELLTMHSKALLEIQTKLKEQNSFYHLLFDALLYQMEANGLTVPAQQVI